jgi:uncharacterized membrane protein (UPF0127 family)
MGRSAFSLMSALISLSGAAFAEPLHIETAEGKVRTFDVEVVSDDAARAKGLMNRTELAADRGMLFVFSQEQMAQFWMKNTLIPLDMIFIGVDGAVRGVHAGAQPNDLTPISSPGRVLGVLEVNGGTAEKLGIAAGDTVKHPVFGNIPKDQLDKP